MSADLVPLAVWDVSEWGRWEGWLEASEWAQEHFPGRARRTYRAEFFLLDAPFAVLYDFKENEAGRCCLDLATGEPVRAEPFTLVLSELPPKHLHRSPDAVAQHPH